MEITIDENWLLDHRETIHERFLLEDYSKAEEHYEDFLIEMSAVFERHKLIITRNVTLEKQKKVGARPTKVIKYPKQ